MQMKLEIALLWCWPLCFSHLYACYWYRKDNLIYTTKAARSVLKQGHLQHRCKQSKGHWKTVNSLYPHLVNFNKLKGLYNHPRPFGFVAHALFWRTAFFKSALYLWWILYGTLMNSLTFSFTLTFYVLFK